MIKGWNNYRVKNMVYKRLAFTGTMLSLLLTIFPIQLSCPIIAIIVVIAILILITIHGYWKIVNSNEIYLPLNGGGKIKICFCDMYKIEGLKVIAFNEYFDTQVDDVIIDKNSNHGKFIRERINNISELDQIIEEDEHAKYNIIDENKERMLGKKIKYKLGTCVKYKDYLLLAFTNFDEHNRAGFTYEDYILCLLKFWKEVNCLYTGDNVVVPLLGAGKTRFIGRDKPEPQELLNNLLITLRGSHLSWANRLQITIVLSEHYRDKIKLYDY